MAKYIYCSFCNTKNKITDSRCHSCGIGLYMSTPNNSAAFEQQLSDNKKKGLKTPLKKCIDIIFAILLLGISSVLSLAILGALISPPIEWNMFLGVVIITSGFTILGVLLFIKKIRLFGFLISSIFWLGFAVSGLNPDLTVTTDHDALLIIFMFSVISIIPFIIVNKKR